MNTTHLLFFFITLLLVFSCKKSDDSLGTSGEYNCVVEESDLFLGIDHALTLIPEKYYEDVDLLFLNESGDSLIMEKSFTFDSTFTSIGEFNCQGTVQSLEMTSTTKRFFFSSTNPEVDIRIDILIDGNASLTNWKYAPREFLSYYPTRKNRPINFPYGAMNIITFEDGEIIASLSRNISEIEFNGRTFRNVYANDNTINDVYHYLYYTKNQGIIAMESPQKELWYFDSFID